jgi:tripartite ATP-independent transporter DctM subunit
MAAFLDVLMFVGVCALLLTGYPVAFALGGTALLFAALGWALGVFDLGFLQALPQRLFGTMTNEVLIAIPLFIYMGVMLERSKVAEDLLSTAGRLMGAVPGGLGLAVTAVGALLAASTGVVGATAVTMGLISLPVMLRAGYDARLACGSIAAAATLAQIIPPSTVLVVLGDQLAIAHQNAELAKGNLAPVTVTVADLFAGALLPGLMLAALYMLYQAAVALFRPARAPALGGRDGEMPGLGELLRVLVAPLALILAVLGSILWGLATPTEAASVGAVGATLLAARRIAPRRAWLIDLAAAALIVVLLLAAIFDLRVARQQIGAGDQVAIAAAFVLVAFALAGTAIAFVVAARAQVLRPVLESTLAITTMIFALLIGATIFSLVFRGLGGDATVHGWLSELPGGPAGAVIVVMLAMFLLGFFLDFLEIVFVIVPVVAPVLLRMEGIDPVWLGVMMAMNMQTSFMHPPLGATLFYLRSVAPPEVRTIDLYLGAVPFVIIQLFALVVLWLTPGLATWLPRMLYGN